MPANLPTQALTKKILTRPYKKSVEIRTHYSLHRLRPSHCPMMSNEQRETHADVFIQYPLPAQVRHITRTPCVRKCAHSGTEDADKYIP